MAEITIRISDKALKMSALALATVVVLWVLYELNSSGVFLPKYEIKMMVPEASGVGRGTSVRLDGMPVGKVSSVRLVGPSPDPSRRIELRLRIEERYQDLIRTDSGASFMSVSLLGDRFVNIQRGFSGQPIHDGEEIQAHLIKEITFGPMDFLDALAKAANCKKDEEASGGNRSEPEAGRATSRK